jgi:uncharacterized protein
MARSFTLSLLLALACMGGAQAQDNAPVPEYVTRPATTPAGQAPGLKATELGPSTRTFQLTFAKGDEVGAGLAEFAEKNHLTLSNFTAIGAFDSAVIGWFDPQKRAYKAIRLNEEMEVTSFTGNITLNRDGKPVVHAHCVVALLRNGAVYAGHFIEGHISLTMQMNLVDAKPLAAAASASR